MVPSGLNQLPFTAAVTRFPWASSWAAAEATVLVLATYVPLNTMGFTPLVGSYVM